MKKLFSITFILVGLIANIQGQGCSDAGFCTSGAIKAMGANDSFKNSLGFTLGYAIGEQGTLIITPQIEPQIKVKEKGMVQIKVPYVHISGDITSSKGLGDVIVTYSYILDSMFKNPLVVTVGTRIATGTSSLKKDKIPLPMPYQSSLGTTDIILGVKLNLKKGISFSFGYQQPIFNRNQNAFDSAAYNLLAKEEKIKPEENFFISSSLKRKGDILLRIDKAFKWPNASVNIGLLPIYHLGKDKVEKINGKETELDGSQGLTLNINASAYYKLSPNFEISAMAAMPLIVRKSRPDGLTRAFVFLPGIRYYL